GRHGAVGEDKAGDTGGREMIDDVLHPGDVGVSDWWFAELPAFVVAQTVTDPIGDVERRVSEDKVGFEIGMAVIVKSVTVGDLAVDAAQREIHFREAPCGVIAFLAVDADVALKFSAITVAALVSVDELD